MRSKLDCRTADIKHPDTTGACWVTCCKARQSSQLARRLNAASLSQAAPRKRPCAPVGPSTVAAPAWPQSSQARLPRPRFLHSSCAHPYTDWRSNKPRDALMGAWTSVLSFSQIASGCGTTSAVLHNKAPSNMSASAKYPAQGGLQQTTLLSLCDLMYLCRTITPPTRDLSQRMHREMSHSPDRQDQRHIQVAPAPQDPTEHPAKLSEPVHAQHCEHILTAHM